MRIVHSRCTMRGPARMGYADKAFQLIGLGLRLQLGHPGGRARALGAAAIVHGYAARVVAAILKTLQTLQQNRNDIAI